ncbi:MAG: sodium/proline symporter [Myxococcota bacterium]|nr:sodium/proline symporter [Myxococcota bacterium]
MIWKLVGIGLYLAILVGIGIAASRRMKDMRDYFAAGKSLGFLSVAFSARATGESAWLLLGLTGMGAAIGLKAFWVVLGEVLGVGIAWLFMSRRFHRLTQRYDSITVPDYLESRFRDRSQAIRKVAALALVIFVTVYVSAQIDATGKAFEDFLSWNYYVGIAVGFAVVLAYTTSGGFLAVVWSDVFQGFLMVIGLAVLPIAALIHIGGWGAVTAKLNSIDPYLMTWTGEQGLSVLGVATILSLALIGLGFLGSPQIFVRFLSLKDESEITKGTATAITWTIIADSGAVLIGMVGRAILADQGLGGDTENVLPMLVEHIMPAFLVGLYIAIVLSATMSTVDSLLVVASSAFVRDYYQQVRHPDLADDQLLSMSRKMTLALAAVGLGVALTVALTTPDRTVFWFVIFGWNGISATFCPTIILSLAWRGMTAKGALYAMVGGFLAVPVFQWGAPALGGELGLFFKELSCLPPAFLVSFILGVVVSLTDRAGREAVADFAQDLQDEAADSPINTTA